MPKNNITTSNSTTVWELIAQMVKLEYSVCFEYDKDLDGYVIVVSKWSGRVGRVFKTKRIVQNEPFDLLKMDVRIMYNLIEAKNAVDKGLYDAHHPKKE